MLNNVLSMESIFYLIMELKLNTIDTTNDITISFKEVIKQSIYY